MLQDLKQPILQQNTPQFHLALDKLEPLQYTGMFHLWSKSKSDGSILVSECNVKGLGIISYRTFDAETAKQFTYVIGH